LFAFKSHSIMSIITSLLKLFSWELILTLNSLTIIS
jgi:hypothetical protein